MGKLLRGLAIVLLILSGIALWLGIYLFGKREILKGRTQKLENTFIALGPFIENEPAEVQPNTFPAKDTADCTSEILETPSKSDFWTTYQYQLEQQDRTTLDIGQRKMDLMSYYKIDPVTLQVERNPQGYKITDGKGTMQNLLTEVLDKAKDQLNRLNLTRRQLTLVREELIKTIEELNGRKAGLRQAMNEIVQLKEKIRQLEEEIVGLKKKIKDLEDEKAALQAQIAELEAKIRQLEDTIKEKDAEIKRQEDDIKKLRLQLAGEPGRGGTVMLEKIEPGEKGKVISVNKEWNFAVIEVTDKFIQEITTKEGGIAQGVHVLVKRADGSFVTKVSVMQVKRDQKIAVANILLDWQQQPVRVGDVVFY